MQGTSTSIQTALEPCRAHKAQTALVSDTLRPACSVFHAAVSLLALCFPLCSGTREWKCTPQSHNLARVPSCAFISLMTLGRPFFKSQLEKYSPPPKFVPRKMNHDNGQIISRCPCLKSSEPTPPHWRAHVNLPSPASCLALCSTLPPHPHAPRGAQRAWGSPEIRLVERTPVMERGAPLAPGGPCLDHELGQCLARSRD